MLRCRPSERIEAGIAGQREALKGAIAWHRNRIAFCDILAGSKA